MRARVDDPQVAALLVAKTSVAAERGLVVDVVNDEPFPRLDPDLAADVVTVLGNLVDNAVEATVAERVAAGGPGGSGGSGGAGEGVRVRLWWADGAAHLTVSDAGAGVAPADRDRIFTRGWSTKAARGRGIGLALVRQVCQRRGGEVSVVGPPDGSGAVFTARLPGATAATAAGAAGAGTTATTTTGAQR